MIRQTTQADGLYEGIATTLALAHRRMSRSATNLLVIGAWVLTTVLAVINGGVRAPAAIAYPALTIMVGWLMARTNEQKQTQEALESSLKDKVALLNEVHHRVKNNLQVITSLLRLEAGRSTQPDTRSVLKDMQGRIRSMALLHESLYRSGTFAGVDLGHYLQQLATQAFRSMAPQDGSVRLQLAMASVKVTMDQATPCGLLLNELMSNSLKHGFPDGLHGEVHVELQPVPGISQVQLLVSDTGVGLGVGFTLLGKKTLGLQLVSDLVRQIAGRIEIGSGPGAVLIVSFQPDTPSSQSTRDVVHAQHHTVA